ncbi:hypothetical protein JTI58_10860 [Lysinibacillus fusiformis]|uniref:hypothetical protein n=1 Tax=Lysinibacillus fusiformis TaxID=28031 RepID=UPI0019682710|nr:hypothetical protein [Lysinibacillus fusiformis]QSB12065.1 hypothetical protein JTI58_10860 [Lysinibacillus fusiformis]
MSETMNIHEYSEIRLEAVDVQFTEWKASQTHPCTYDKAAQYLDKIFYTEVQDVMIRSELEVKQFVEYFNLYRNDCLADIAIKMEKIAVCFIIRVSGEILFDSDNEEMLMFKTAAEAYEHVEVLKLNGALKDYFLTDVEVDYMVYANE